MPDVKQINDFVVDIYMANQIAIDTYNTESKDLSEDISVYIFHVYRLDRREFVCDCVDAIYYR